MSNCTLDKYVNYDASSVKHDLTEDKYVVTLKNPPKSCPDAQWVGKASTSIDDKINSSMLTYSSALGHPVVLVPNQTQILDINKPVPINFPLFGIFGCLVIGGFIGHFFYKKVKIKKDLEFKKRTDECLTGVSKESFEGCYSISQRDVSQKVREFNEKMAEQLAHQNYCDQRQALVNSQHHQSSQLAGALAGVAVGAALGYGVNEFMSNRDSSSDNSNIPEPSNSNSYSSDNSSYISDTSSYSSSDSSYTSDNSSYSSDSSSYSSDDSSY